MKKILFRLLSVLALSAFIGSCVQEDTEVLEMKKNEVPEMNENESSKALTTIIPSVSASSSADAWRIVSYEGGWIHHDIANNELIIGEGTIINAKGNYDIGLWKTEGPFTIIGANDRPNVKIKRTSPAAGAIIYEYIHEGYLWRVRMDLVAYPVPYPNPASCPKSTHARMRGSESTRTVYAENYNSQYLYKWTVTKGGNTYHTTGDRVAVGPGGCVVTLTVVSADRCQEQKRTQSFWFDACPTC